MKKYTFVVDKIRKVIYSCNNINQLVIADKYCKMLIDHITDIKDNNSIEINIKKRDMRFSLLKWMNTLMVKKKMEIIKELGDYSTLAERTVSNAVKDGFDTHVA